MSVHVGGLETSSPSVIVIMEAARSVSNFEQISVQFKTYLDSTNDALVLCQKRDIRVSRWEKSKRHGRLHELSLTEIFLSRLTSFPTVIL